MSHPHRIAAAVLTLLVSHGASAQLWIPVEQHRIPGGRISGLAYGDGHLWLGRLDYSRVYRIDTEAGFTVVDSLTPAISHPDLVQREDMAWALGDLWIATDHTYTIFRVDDGTGALIDQHSYDVRPEGLTYDGSNLWMQPRPSPVDLHCIDPATMDVVYSLPTQFELGEGLAWDGEYFWVAEDDSAHSINRVRIDSSGVEVLQSFSAPEALGAGAEGLAWDGESLWYAEFTTNSVWRLAFSSVGDTLLVVDAVDQCVDLLSSFADNRSTVAGLVLESGVAYGVVVGGQCFLDGALNPMDGVTVLYSDQAGMHRTEFPPGSEFSFINGAGGTDVNFAAYVSDLAPEDNSGQFFLIVHRIGETGAPGDAAPDTAPPALIRWVAPNPFSRGASVAYSVATPGDVTVSIYGVSGRLVRTLRRSWMPAGEYRETWDGAAESGTPVASGVYFARVVVGDAADTRKLTLLR